MAPRYWWVNQNKTFQQERSGGYLWSPKKKANGHRNPFYDFMRIVSPGDVVLSFAQTRIPAYGIATSPCYEAPKPVEFGAAGEEWSDIGWRVDVAYFDLPKPIRPADFMAELSPLMPEKYAPLAHDGRGLQSVYLTTLSNQLMARIAFLIGEPLTSLLDAPPLIARDSASENNPVQERWERTQLAELNTQGDLSETVREQIVDARVGQGKFRAGVIALEPRCRVTRVDRSEHLIASHIRPWRHADNAQRLDPENGFMLTPNVDHLFDRGFLTFTEDGVVQFSPAADRESLLRMGLDPDREIDVGSFSSAKQEFLEFHRSEIFLGSA